MRVLPSGLTRRRLALGGGGVISVGLGGGCAPFVGGGAVAQPTAVKKKGPVALTLHHRWDGELREPAVESQLREFRQLHPHVTVSVSVGREAAVVTSAAGAGADVSMLHSNEAAVVARRGGLLALDAHLTKEGVKPEEVWFPAGLTLTRVPGSGKTVALPLTASGDAPFLFYNKTMLRQEGIEAATLGTWEGLLAASRALTKPLGDLFIQVGFPYPAGHFPTWLLVNGVEPLSHDGRTPAFNTAAARETLEYVVESGRAVYGRGRLNTFLAQTFTHRRGGQDAAFEQQRMAAWLTGPYVWQEVPKFVPGLEFGAARMPVNTANPRSKATTLADGTWTWAISAGSQHPDEAWRLAKWLGLEDGHRSLMIRLGRPSMMKRVSQDRVFHDLNPGWPLILDALQNATALPPGPALPKLLGLLEGLPSDVVGARFPSAEAALAAAEAEAKRLLATP
ncbi:MAG TPA: extracellular solute-binding protein [Chloroflexota bacterium]|nr:extracellular solute-binding protein [Chloroflexota bacterium]